MYWYFKKALSSHYRISSNPSEYLSWIKQGRVERLKGGETKRCMYSFYISRLCIQCFNSISNILVKAKVRLHVR